MLALGHVAIHDPWLLGPGGLSRSCWPLDSRVRQLPSWARAVFQAPAHARSTCVRRLENLFTVFGMSLIHRSRDSKFQRRISENLVVRRTVVEPRGPWYPQPRSCPRHFRDEPEQFLAFKQLFSDCLYLEVLVNRADVEQQHLSTSPKMASLILIRTAHTREPPVTTLNDEQAVAQGRTGIRGCYAWTGKPRRFRQGDFHGLLSFFLFLWGYAASSGPQLDEPKFGGGTHEKKARRKSSCFDINHQRMLVSLLSTVSCDSRFVGE
jgi:hypothetical protein